MDQRWICGAMLTAGIGLCGVVLWIQSDRYAFTNLQSRVDPGAIQMVIAPSKAEEPRAPAHEAEPVLELPAERIVGRKPAPAAVTSEPPPEHVPSPCSPWEEIGPTHVDDGIPSGIRRFRKLC